MPGQERLPRRMSTPREKKATRTPLCGGRPHGDGTEVMLSRNGTDHRSDSRTISTYWPSRTPAVAAISLADASGARKVREVGSSSTGSVPPNAAGGAETAARL